MDAWLLPVFLYLTEEPMEGGFGTSLSHPRVCACPVEDVFMGGGCWGRPGW